jgi:hypothetical protein
VSGGANANELDSGFYRHDNCNPGVGISAKQDGSSQRASQECRDHAALRDRSHPFRRIFSRKTSGAPGDLIQAGVGYFEHLGPVRNDQKVQIDSPAASSTTYCNRSLFLI